MATFGEGLGSLAGGILGAQDLEAGIDRVNGQASAFGASVAPYSNFGANFLPTVQNVLLGQTTNPTIGQQRLDGTGNGVKQYDDFMKDYQASPGSQYIINQAQTAQDNSAASRGKLLSGGNLRSLSTLTENLSNTFANQAYGQYLAGNNQEFNQLEQTLGNMFTAIGVGSTANGQQAGVTSSQMGANAQLAAAQAKNDSSKGSGLGSMFSGLGSLATLF